MTVPKWIGFYTGGFDKSSGRGAPSPYFRKEFECADVKSAVLKISSLGVFKAFLNGCEIDNDLLSPGWTDYNKRVPYVQYDVTDKLTGKDCLGVVLGDGWYCGKIASFGREKYGTYPLGLWAELTITKNDGNVIGIVTDESWQATTGAVRSSDIYDGVIEDNTLAVDFSVFGSSAKYESVTVLEKVKTVPEASLCEPIRRHEVFALEKIGEYDGKQLFDCSQNMAAVIDLLMRGERGASVTVRYGEMVIDGKLYTENLRSAKATDIFTLRGDGDERFCPYLTYHGFRYVEIDIRGKAEIVSANAVAIYNDLKTEGHISCSSDLVNKIISNTMWSQKSNFVTVPTDCPQRDERLGWTGDAEIFCGTAMFNMNAKNFFRKYLQDVRDEQHPDGGIADFNPMVLNNKNTSAAWGDVIAVLPYFHYLMYGDVDIIRENVAAGVRWIDFSEKKMRSPLRRRFGYGDWLNVNAHTDKYLIGMCYLAYSAILVSKLQFVINDHKSRDHVVSIFNRTRRKFRLKFVKRNGRLTSDTQTAYCLAYATGMISKEEARDNLVRLLSERDNLLSTGFVGVKFLLPTLCDIGRSDLAYSLITETRYPSWGYSVVNGATSIWERWNSYTIENGLGDVRMNSFNHYSYGSCVEWMYRYMLGIIPSEDFPGLKAVTLRPYIDTTGKITHAEGSFRDISIEWHIDPETKIAKYVAKFDHTLHKVDFEFPGAEIIDKKVSADSAEFTLKYAK